MKLRQLEILLEKVAGFSSPAAHLEQYPTSAPLAARLLFHAAQNGDITGKTTVISVVVQVSSPLELHFLVRGSQPE